MSRLTVDIPESLAVRLAAETERSGRSRSTIVTDALAGVLDTTLHTLFQISTSGSLVTGVYQGAITVADLLSHGDFGLGTFENLDGELVVLDGQAYRVRGIGETRVAEPADVIPFAVVNHFTPATDTHTPHVASLRELSSHCDTLRKSGNIFYALRLDGRFDRVKTRAVSPPAPHARLIDAAKSQHEFEFSDIAGSLVGVWSPGFSSAFSVPGYHFHFLSDDRHHGGHLLECSAISLRIRIEALTGFHLALPETAAYLEADLSMNTAAELAYAEQNH